MVEDTSRNVRVRALDRRVFVARSAERPGGRVQTALALRRALVGGLMLLFIAQQRHGHAIAHCRQSPTGDAADHVTAADVCDDNVEITFGYLMKAEPPRRERAWVTG